MKVFYSCMVDRNALFQYQGWLWANSLITNAKVDPQYIWIHCVNGVDEDFKAACAELGVHVSCTAPFGDKKHCNKIAQMFNPALRDADIVVLMDTDTFVLENFEAQLDPQRICGKPVDYPVPETAVFDALFPLACLGQNLPPMKTTCTEAYTYGGNFNGGLYCIPAVHFDTMREAWPKWANWLLAHVGQADRVAFPNVHIDQMSFCMAMQEHALPFKELDTAFNFPLHVLDAAERAPLMLHYHWKLNQVGLIESVSDATLNEAITRANETVGKSFNNRIFWNYRYATNQELGSGVGSRGENLKRKKRALQELGIETYDSVLDIGFGDLELMKDFHIRNYQGLDVSTEAIRNAKAQKPDWKFNSMNDLSLLKGKKYAYVQCLDVLIHQKTQEEFDRVLNLAIDKTTQRLLISGFTAFDSLYQGNHMLAFHGSLEEKLISSGKFQRVTRLFTISCADYYVCDVIQGSAYTKFSPTLLSHYFVLRGSSLFDTAYYLETYPEAKKARGGSILHYLRHGASMGYNPSQAFDTQLYLEDNPDVKSSGINPLVHYIQYGKKEGRIAKQNISAPNDMPAEVMRMALFSVDDPETLRKIAACSRQYFGWYTKHFPRAYEYPWLYRKMGNVRGKRIGDLGAGVTPMPILFAQDGAHVVTVDSSEMHRSLPDIENANEWGFLDYHEINENITSHNVLLERTTFEAESFDCWYSISVVEHMPAAIRRELLGTIHYLLKKNGELFITLDLVKGSEQLWNYNMGKQVEDERMHGSLNEIKEELQKIGFTIEEERVIRMPAEERVDIAWIHAYKQA